MSFHICEHLPIKNKFLKVGFLGQRMEASVIWVDNDNLLSLRILQLYIPTGQLPVSHTVSYPTLEVLPVC